jgi:hypothetical protein
MKSTCNLVVLFSYCASTPQRVELLWRSKHHVLQETLSVMVQAQRPQYLVVILSRVQWMSVAVRCTVCMYVCTVLYVHTEWFAVEQVACPGLEYIIAGADVTYY